MLSEGEAVFSSTLDADAASPELTERKSHLGISARARAQSQDQDEGLWWGCAVVACDDTVPRDGPASCDIENWTYLGVDPCGSHRLRCLGAIAAPVHLMPRRLGTKKQRGRPRGARIVRRRRARLCPRF